MLTKPLNERRIAARPGNSSPQTYPIGVERVQPLDSLIPRKYYDRIVPLDRDEWFLPSSGFVYHPEGWRLGVPQGAEAFFNRVRNAILRNPQFFISGWPTLPEVCERLSVTELRELHQWFERSALALDNLSDEEVPFGSPLRIWINNNAPRVKDIFLKRHKAMRENFGDDYFGQYGGGFIAHEIPDREDPRLSVVLGRHHA